MSYIRPEQQRSLADVDTKQRTKDGIATAVIGGVIVIAAATLVGGVATIISSIIGG